MKVCIDNHILVWGIGKQAKKGQEAMIERAEAFLEKLKSEKHQVIIPAPVVTEFLVGIQEDRHPEVLRTLQTHFMIAAFDVPSSVYASQVWKCYYGQQDLLNGPPPDGISSWRTKLKVDCQVLGIAKRHQVDVLYTNDNGLLRMAKNFVRAERLPEIQIQGSLRFGS
ncbi:MAG: hypothetical protein CW346_17455 [Bacillaceae bacterium]|nr:hypothetical protein [Bacillaceae bacterium]